MTFKLLHKTGDLRLSASDLVAIPDNAEIKRNGKGEYVSINKAGTIFEITDKKIRDIFVAHNNVQDISAGMPRTGNTVNDALALELEKKDELLKQVQKELALLKRVKAGKLPESVIDEVAPEPEPEPVEEPEPPKKVTRTRKKKGE